MFSVAVYFACLLALTHFGAPKSPPADSRLLGLEFNDLLGNNKRATSFVEDSIEFDRWLINENPLNFTEETLVRMRKDLENKKDTLRKFKLVHKEFARWQQQRKLNPSLATDIAAAERLDTLLRELWPEQYVETSPPPHESKK